MEAREPRTVLEELRAGQVVVCDGAMGPMLHAAGIPLDRSLPELNLSRPVLVRDLHMAYVSAGAQILQTNTFGADSPMRARRTGSAGRSATPVTRRISPRPRHGSWLLGPPCWGGCCGTTPAHVRAVSQAVAALPPVPRAAQRPPATGSAIVRGVSAMPPSPGWLWEDELVVAVGLQVSNGPQVPEFLERATMLRAPQGSVETGSQG